jgi:sucrose phosphorylase
VYYVGLLAGRNDMALLQATGVGRDINRHYYDHDEIVRELQSPIVQDHIALIRFRNAHPAFDGNFRATLKSETKLTLHWHANDGDAILDIDFATLNFSITATGTTAAPTFSSFN